MTLFGIIKSAVYFALAIYLGLMALMYLMQDRMVYQPTRGMVDTPAARGLPFTELRVEDGQGHTLHGWFVSAEGARGTVLFCHGNAGNIGDRLDTIALLASLDMNVLIFDYAGYGKSNGAPDEENTYAAAQVMYRWLVDGGRETPERIVAMGRSLGGAVAAHLAAAEPVAGLVLESTFTSAPDLAADVYPFFPARWLCTFEYDTLGLMDRIRVPILFLHSTDDEIVPHEHAMRLFTAYRGRKLFADLAGGHNTGWMASEADYREALGVFFTSLDL